MASNILPDTCAWIDFFRGSPTHQAELVNAAIIQGEVVTCGVVLYELLQGIRNPAEEQKVLAAFQCIPHLEMTAKLWITAGQLSSNLRSSGHTIPMSDIVIAILAVEHGSSVLTVDRHFADIPGIKVLV